MICLLALSRSLVYVPYLYCTPRQIAGPKSTTVPQAGLFTEARAGPLAQQIVTAISNGADPDEQLLYNPLNWAFANNTPFPAEFNWLANPVKKIINGRSDAFSQRLVTRSSTCHCLFLFLAVISAHCGVRSNLLTTSSWHVIRLGQECQPFSQDAPDTPLFDTKKVAIVSNGR